MAIRIVTDSVSDLPPALAQANDITVIPCYVIIGSETYKDGVEITADRFYSRLPTLSRLPSTSQPTIADFQGVYQQLLDQGHQILSIHVSAKLSGTLNSASQARAALGDSSDIEIVDSQLASAPMALAVLDAAQRARETSDVHEVARQVRGSLLRNHGFVMVDTLEYLQKGGRIGKAQAFVGGMLKVKPILTIRDGEVHPVERPAAWRGRKTDWWRWQGNLLPSGRSTSATARNGCKPWDCGPSWLSSWGLTTWWSRDSARCWVRT